MTGFSLNEVEAMAKKAVRGAGYPWGIAEDASTGVRWLCARDLDGVGALAGLLHLGYGSDLSRHLPVVGTAAWAARATLCPLMTASALSDHAKMLPSTGLRLSEISMPVLLVPALGRVAMLRNETVTLTLGAVTVSTDGHDVAVSDPLPAVAAEAQISFGLPHPDGGRRVTRAMPRPEDWEVLARFAHRTYAPATDQSRLLGAGAGLSDGD